MMHDLILFFIPGGIFLILSSVFLTIGLVRKRKINRSLLTEGEIIKKGLFFKHTPDHFPTVKYEVNGTVYEHTSRISQRPGLTPGTQVDIYYHPEKPEKAIINSFVQRGSLFTLIGSILGVIALATIVIPIILFLMS